MGAILKNKRLEAILREQVVGKIGGGWYLLDCYMGRCVRKTVSHTITTRTATDSNTFVLEVYEEGSVENPGGHAEGV